MRVRDQSSIFSTGGKFRPDYGLLLELHALTLVAHSYALLPFNTEFTIFEQLYKRACSLREHKGFYLAAEEGKPMETCN